MGLNVVSNRHVLAICMTERPHLTTRFRYRFTRIGIHFAFVALFAIVGGSIRGFNLLLVLAGFLVAVLIVQWRSSRRAIGYLTVRRRIPSSVFAGAAFRITYLVKNNSRWLAVWMIRLDDRLESVMQGRANNAPCRLGSVGPNDTESTFYDCVINKRGRYRLGPIRCSTSYPFALLTSAQIIDDREQLFVYPARLPLRRDWRQRLSTRAGQVASSSRRGGPDEGNFFGLREWQSGDSSRWIHWRTSARTLTPVVRQFEQSTQLDICLLVDTFTDGADRSVQMEQAISLAATLLSGTPQHDGGGSANDRFSLAIAADDSQVISHSHSASHQLQMLEALATIQGTEQPHLSEAILSAADHQTRSGDLVIISSRSLSEAQAAESDLPKMIATWRRHGSVRWIDVSRELGQWTVTRNTKLQTQSDSIADRTLVGHSVHAEAV